MDEQPIALDGLVLQAFVDHCIAAERQRWENEQLAELQAAGEPIREHLRRTADDPEWNERRQAALAAKERRRQEILARRAQVAQTKESA